MGKMTVQEFATQLAADFAGECSAVVLYGSGATASEPTQGSDVNLLVIVKTLPPDALHRAAPTVRRWQESGQRAPLILTEAEWRSSRDVFAMEHADIAARHKLLQGALPQHSAALEEVIRRLCHPRSDTDYELSPDTLMAFLK